MIGGKREGEYLEAMYILMRRKGIIRIKDLAKILRIKPSSVVEYLDRLSKKGLVHYEKYGLITLTDKGLKVAREIYKRHVALKEFLMLLLKIPEDVAEEDACYIEHGIHEITLDRIMKFLKFVKECPKGFPDFLEHLDYYYKYEKYPDTCPKR